MRANKRIVVNWLSGLLFALVGCGWKPDLSYLAAGSNQIAASQPACLTHSDCHGAEPQAPGCTASAWSCIDGQCLWECNGARDCTNDPTGQCLSCSTGLSCYGGNCSNYGPVGRRLATVVSSTCVDGPVVGSGGAGPAFGVERIPTACGFQAFWGDDRLGNMLFSSSGFVAQFPSLGGTCVGCCGVEATVATAGGQWDFSCPRCQFTVRF